MATRSGRRSSCLTAYSPGRAGNRPSYTLPPRLAPAQPPRGRRPASLVRFPAQHLVDVHAHPVAHTLDDPKMYIRRALIEPVRRLPADPRRLRQVGHGRPPAGGRVSRRALSQLHPAATGSVADGRITTTGRAVRADALVHDNPKGFGLRDHCARLPRKWWRPVLGLGADCNGSTALERSPKEQL